MRKLILITTLCAGLASCDSREAYIVIRLRLDCFGPAISQLDDAIITSKYSDFGVSGSGGSKSAGPAELLGPKTVYKQNLKRHSDGYYYIDSVPKKQYSIFYVEAKIAGYDYHAFKRKNDFTNASGDTLLQTLCLEPMIKLIEQTSY